MADTHSVSGVRNLGQRYEAPQRPAPPPQPVQTIEAADILRPVEDDEVLEAFRERADADGRGYQTMINEALREHLGRSREPVSADTIRRIVREELRKTG